jgi:hypothetical protein
MLRLTQEGYHYLQLNLDERSLRMHILWSLENGNEFHFSDVVDNIRANYDEYKFTEVKFFAKHVADMVKEGLVSYNHDV